DAFHRWINRVEGAAGDGHNRGKLALDRLIARLCNTLDDRFQSFDLNFTSKGQLWQTQKLRDTTRDHASVAICALSGAENQIGVFLLQNGSKHTSSTQRI